MAKWWPRKRGSHRRKPTTEGEPERHQGQSSRGGCTRSRPLVTRMRRPALSGDCNRSANSRRQTAIPVESSAAHGASAKPSQVTANSRGTFIRPRAAQACRPSRDEEAWEGSNEVGHLIVVALQFPLVAQHSNVRRILQSMSLLHYFVRPKPAEVSGKQSRESGWMMRPGTKTSLECRTPASVCELTALANPWMIGHGPYSRVPR